MTDELFPTEPTPPTPLQKARARLEKAEAELLRAEKLHDEQGPEAWDVFQRACSEFRAAEYYAELEENRETERLRAAREPA